MRVRHRRSLLSLVLLVAGYAALIAAWTIGNPLGRAPDEPAHYVRALAAAEGVDFPTYRRSHTGNSFENGSFVRIADLAASDLARQVAIDGFAAAF